MEQLNIQEVNSVSGAAGPVGVVLGAVGGGISGGISGGFSGALKGMAIGAVSGFLGGWAGSLWNAGYKAAAGSMGSHSVLLSVMASHSDEE
ncbi:hypothetical protein [Alteromonas sp. H39]|uniref:hypothetical protein n=1 Tax=Alteromonas sp. H39 TaxID=3389876 RepID=UPI0039DF600B